jgi:hypothetical protein
LYSVDSQRLSRQSLTRRKSKEELLEEYFTAATQY